jgi:CHASE3 domain sensor protein
MKTKSPLNRRAQLAFGSAVLTLFLAGVISYRAMVLSSEGEKCVRRTQMAFENQVALCRKASKESC